MNKLNWQDGYNVAHTDLINAFDQVEEEVNQRAADIGALGVSEGLEVGIEGGLIVNLSAGVAYDETGARGSHPGGTLNLSQDSDSELTEVVSSGNERWLLIAIKHAVIESDPIDQTEPIDIPAFNRQLEDSYEIVVRQGDEAGSGLAVRPDVLAGEVVICDVLRRFGVATLISSDIDLDRRRFVRLRSPASIALVAGRESVDVDDGATEVRRVEIDNRDLHPHAQLELVVHGRISAGLGITGVAELYDEDTDETIASLTFDITTTATKRVAIDRGDAAGRIKDARTAYTLRLSCSGTSGDLFFVTGADILVR